MWPNADLVTFTEEIHNRKIHFCAVVRLEHSLNTPFHSTGLFLYPWKRHAFYTPYVLLQNWETIYQTIAIIVDIRILS